MKEKVIVKKENKIERETHCLKLASLSLLSLGAYSFPYSYWNMLKRPSIILGSPEARLTIWSLEPDTAATATIKMMNIFMVELIRGKEVDGGEVKRGVYIRGLD